MWDVGYQTERQLRTLLWIILGAMAAAILLVEVFKMMTLGTPVSTAFLEWSLSLVLSATLVYLCFTVIYRIHRCTVQQAERVAALSAVALTASHSVQLSEVLNRALEKVRQVLEADYAAIYLVDESGHTLELAAWVGRGDEGERASRVPADAGHLGSVIRGGSPVITTAAPGPGTIQPRKVAGVPLQARDGLLGALQVSSPSADFEDDQLTFLAAMASQIALAVDNARLRAQMEAQAVRHKQAQERLVRTAQLTTAGELAGGVAHEVNNPLAVILGTAQLILQRSDLPGDLRRDVELIASNAERIGQITKGFAELTRAWAAKRGPVDLNQVVRATAQGIEETLIQGNIALQLDLAPELPLIHGHTGQLQQVLRMLLTNAVEAMGTSGAGGSIRITTQHLGHEVIVAVSDSGPGIAPADLPRVFEPGFTTKVTGGTVRGIGLGLFTAQAIIQAHDGTIEVDSTLGEGTTFVIRLPAMVA